MKKLRGGRKQRTHGHVEESLLFNVVKDVRERGAHFDLAAGLDGRAAREIGPTGGETHRRAPPSGLRGTGSGKARERAGEGQSAAAADEGRSGSARLVTPDCGLAAHHAAGGGVPMETSRAKTRWPETCFSSQGVSL